MDGPRQRVPLRLAMFSFQGWPVPASDSVALPPPEDLGLCLLPQGHSQAQPPLSKNTFKHNLLDFSHKWLISTSGCVVQYLTLHKCIYRLFRLLAVPYWGQAPGGNGLLFNKELNFPFSSWAWKPSLLLGWSSPQSWISHAVERKTRARSPGKSHK